MARLRKRLTSSFYNKRSLCRSSSVWRCSSSSRPSNFSSTSTSSTMRCWNCGPAASQRTRRLNKKKSSQNGWMSDYWQRRRARTWPWCFLRICQRRTSFWNSQLYRWTPWISPKYSKLAHEGKVQKSWAAIMKIKYNWILLVAGRVVTVSFNKIDLELQIS